VVVTAALAGAAAGLAGEQAGRGLQPPALSAAAARRGTGRARPASFATWNETRGALHALFTIWVDDGRQPTLPDVLCFHARWVLVAARALIDGRAPGTPGSRRRG
jgi:hypothetical protein